MSIFHDVPTPLSFANKKNKMELVKLVKDVPKDIIDGTGACPVQFFAEDERSLPRRSGRSYWGEFNRGGLPSSIPEGYLTGVQKTKMI